MQAKRFIYRQACDANHGVSTKEETVALFEFFCFCRAVCSDVGTFAHNNALNIWRPAVQKGVKEIG